MQRGGQGGVWLPRNLDYAGGTHRVTAVPAGSGRAVKQGGDAVVIREYADGDERGWVICRVLSFLDTAYFDNVLTAKERYEHPAIELVAAEHGAVIGLCDVECEEEAGTVCSDRPGLGGMVWHVAVHPDHRRRGVGRALIREAEARARARGLRRLEAWTRDDAWVHRWYEALGFQHLESYLHVYIDGPEAGEAIRSGMDGLMPVQTFAHYVGSEPAAVRARFQRVHECRLYERRWDAGT